MAPSETGVSAVPDATGQVSSAETEGNVEAGATTTSAPVGRRLRSPSALPAPESLDLPETLGYRIKKKLLGPPLASERQSIERLGKPTALAVLSSDVISSSAYATEQMLIPLIPAVGVAAFSLVVPITLAVIFVLVCVTLSYLEVVKVYTKAGGAYVVARENFGLGVAQVAAVSLLIDYTLTVAVSVAAGVAAVTSVFPSLVAYQTWISVALVLLLAYGNLRGIREAGRSFAVPTYFFVANMFLMIGAGIVKVLLGKLHAHSIHHHGAYAAGHSGHGLLLGAGVFVVLRAFSSGGSALTGTEAISNGVSVFRQPEARNARITLGIMAVLLGSLILGVSVLAALTHPVPYVSGTPTVVSQIARYVYGSGALGSTLYVLLQAATMLILVLAANTSFTGFPFLASFAAQDSYLPRQLTRRGHRLVFSTGIIALTAVSIALLVITHAQVDSLIPLYAIGVFTGFTMAGAGMARYHLTHREPAWRRRLAVNGAAAVLSFVVLLVIAVSKFTEGAWTVVVLLPLGVLVLFRLHRQYVQEDAELEAGAEAACEAPVLKKHKVVVMVDRLDLATARALQYARTLAPDELRAVHFEIDPAVARTLESEWRRLGLARLPLDVIECPDRRLNRAALELCAEAVADGETELTVLLPRRAYRSVWSRLLHDRTADRIADVVGQVPHVSPTMVPYQFTQSRSKVKFSGSSGAPSRERSTEREDELVPRDVGAKGEGTTPIGELAWRRRAKVAGRVKSVRVQPRSGTASLEAVLEDRSGGMLLVFQGRREVPGIQPGTRLVAEGMVGEREGRLAMLNPSYELVAEPES